MGGVPPMSELVAVGLTHRPIGARARVLCPLLVLAGAMLVSVAPVLAQDEDEDPRTLTLPGSGREVPLYVVEGDIFILDDHDWCENLIALTEEDVEAGDALVADPARTDRCTAFLARLQENDVTLLPLSLAGQLVALPDELQRPVVVPTLEPGPDLVSVTGSGETASRTFDLVGGDYRATVETSAACESFAAFLIDTQQGLSVADIKDSGELPGIPTAEYQWDVLAPDCDWSITLESR